MDKNYLNENICIIGAGLTGSLLSIMLANRGFKVDLYEKRPDIRKEYDSGNRTIAMSISTRGRRALHKVGIEETIIKDTIPKYSRVVHKFDGSTWIQQYGKQGDSINTIDRRQLNSILINKAEKTKLVNLYPNTLCLDIQIDSGSITFLNEISGNSFIKKYNKIIGADGIFSVIRNTLENKDVIKSNFKKTNYGYRELIIPPNKNGQFQLNEKCVHVWPQKNYILVCLPSSGGKFTCNLFLPSEGELSLKEIKTEKEINSLFDNKFPSVKPLMPNLIEDYFNNSASDIMTVECSPWNYKDRILLIGDAAHAIVPFFAMGMNVGFEDCTVFDNLMDTYNEDLSKVFVNYSKIRKPDTDCISDLSLKNFNEISKSPNMDYHEMWKLNRNIWEVFPDKWMPLYTMIAFSNIPFSKVVEQNEFQHKIIEEIFKLDKNIFSNNKQLKEFIAPYLANKNIFELVGS